MKTKNIFYLGILSIGLASCSVEAPFKGETDGATGQFLKSTISLDLKSDENIKVKSTETRAPSDLIKDFEITFIDAEKGNKYNSYTYSDMPEIVNLPQGKYKILATYGDENMEADWNNPHFKGESTEFTITADKVNSDIAPIVCSLQNIMVSVVFDDELLAHISDNPQVEVYVNKDKSLTYTKDHSDNLTPGYFKHSDVSTLTAKFTATVDDVLLTEVKTLDNIQPGNHYRLTFMRHSFNGEDHGQAGLEIVIDASVSVNEVGAEYEVGEDEPMTDVTFPTESPGDNGDNDNNEDDNKDPENPDTPDTPGNPDDINGSDVKVTFGAGTTVEFGEDKVNEITEDTKISLNIVCEKGLKAFKIDIDSPDDTLREMKLDLINTGDQDNVETLRGLQLLPDDKDSLLGETKVFIDISTFIPILCGIEGVHTFTITISESEDPEEVQIFTLVLKVNI